MTSLILALACLVSIVSGDSATIYSMPQLESWAEDSLMTLQISVPDGGDYLISTASVLPLTSSIGLNQSQTVRGYIIYDGYMVPADTNNYVNITSHDTVAYLSCDSLNNSNISPDMLVNTLMSNNPQAILLYSLTGTCCGLMGSNLPYQTIFTMVDRGDAADVLNLTLQGGSEVKATISGNSTSPAQQNAQESSTGNNSAVAMSILYSITGLITLLFLIIIATGAIRAHRYPERYGPRSGFGGRPRQSRAKGLARAVLETLPIVKFGDSSAPTKPDPTLELEHQAERASQDPTPGEARVSAVPDDSRFTQSPRTGGNDAEQLGAVPDNQAIPAVPEASGAAGSTDEHLGCSICTEDFTVGEDVRVLPCDHKFHPPCIDPWLVNVSGTCPLCRLDLRPHADQENAETSEDRLQHSPPLDADAHAQGQSQGTTGESAEQATSSTPRGGRRVSRTQDLQRLLHAPLEERVEGLRRHASQQQHHESAISGDLEERSRRARLADRLREKFRIRTRTQTTE